MSNLFNCPHCWHEYDGERYFEDAQRAEDEEVECDECGKVFLAGFEWVSEMSCSSRKKPCLDPDHKYVVKEYGGKMYNECSVCDQYGWV